MDNSYFNFEVRVYYDSTDAGGVVYHSKYMDFCERARTEFLRSLGITQSILLNESGVGFVVRKAGLEFRKSAKLDDLLKVTVKIDEISGAVLRLKQDVLLISREDKAVENELLFTLNVEIVAINKDGKLVRIPKDIYNKLLRS